MPSIIPIISPLVHNLLLLEVFTSAAVCYSGPNMFDPITEFFPLMKYCIGNFIRHLKQQYINLFIFILIQVFAIGIMLCTVWTIRFIRERRSKKVLLVEPNEVQINDALIDTPQVEIPDFVEPVEVEIVENLPLLRPFVGGRSTPPSRVLRAALRHNPHGLYAIPNLHGLYAIPNLYGNMQLGLKIARICQGFAQLAPLLVQVLEGTDQETFIQTPLESTLVFLDGIPLVSESERPEIDSLISRILAAAEIRIRMFPASTDTVEVYKPSEPERVFLLALAIFLTKFLSSYAQILAAPVNRALLLKLHLHLIKISNVDDRGIFDVCLEYWVKLVAEMYATSASTVGNGGSGQGIRESIHEEVLISLRLIMIERMAKPAGVWMVRNKFRAIDIVDHVYTAMRQLLIYLTHLSPDDTAKSLTETLSKLVYVPLLPRAIFNSICWAIGSISETMSAEMEKRFLIAIIGDLLVLFQMQGGEEDRSIVASNVMYIIGQYPRFLKAHYELLKTVVEKLFEFANETHESVRDMACLTFLKIARDCGNCFVTLQSGEEEPFINEILKNLLNITIYLNRNQINTIYEAVAYILSAQNYEPQEELLIAELSKAGNSVYVGFGTQKAPVLTQSENFKLLSTMLKEKISFSSIGSAYVPELKEFHLNLMNVYTSVSAQLSQAIQFTAEQGSEAPTTPRTQELRSIKAKILELLGEAHLKNPSNLILPHLKTILVDYKQDIPAAREVKVLGLLITIFTRLGPLMTSYVPSILFEQGESSRGLN